MTHRRRCDMLHVAILKNKLKMKWRSNEESEKGGVKKEIKSNEESKKGGVKKEIRKGGV